MKKSATGKRDKRMKTIGNFCRVNFFVILKLKCGLNSCLYIHMKISCG